MNVLEMVSRGKDSWGDGAFGAPRGSRVHRGHDFLAYVECPIESHVQGTVTKLGKPYSDDLTYEYIQVTDGSGNDHRFFYVKPCVKKGERIEFNQRIGHAQNLGKRYNKNGVGIPNHIHYEIKSHGEFINPEVYLWE